MSGKTYLKALLDPFDRTIDQLKLMDGRLPRSASIRFRGSTQITCHSDGNPTYIILHPGLANCLQATHISGTLGEPLSIFPNHAATQTEKDLIKSWRYVGAALRVSLINSADQNEGFWEAIRVPAIAGTHPALPTGTLALALTQTEIDQYADMAQHSTYQSGKLRDIHRVQFKLNSVNPDHEFETGVQELDPWDMVVIKISGRVSATGGSILKLDTMAIQEVVYEENSALGRLMTANHKLPNFDRVLERSSPSQPALLAA